jgi:hypothetical protein
MAAVISGGSYPIDPTQGFPGGRFAAASIRFTRGHRRQNPARAAMTSAPVREAGDSADIAAFTWKRVSAREVMLQTTAVRARVVEVSGDFTGWTPLKLTSTGEGTWTLTLPIAPGQYQMNLRVDGGPWVVPRGLLPIVDEFGGAVGLLIVE